MEDNRERLASLEKFEELICSEFRNDINELRASIKELDYKFWSIIVLIVAQFIAKAFKIL